jgi:hypothetical protein
MKYTEDVLQLLLLLEIFGNPKSTAPVIPDLETLQ